MIRNDWFTKTRKAWLVLCGLGLFLTLAVGCAQLRQRAPGSFTASGAARIDRTQAVAATARRDALLKAQAEACNQLLKQAGQLPASGGTLEDLAATDPFVRASFKDIVRAAQITNRVVSEDGSVSVTVRLEREPLLRMIENYPLHSLK